MLSRYLLLLFGFACNAQQTEMRRDFVKEQFKFAWNSYVTQAMGKDELNPITGVAKPSVWGGWGVTLIDSLDTLYIMGLTKEFYEALNVLRTINFSKGNITTSFFEVTIRNLGGLLSAYDLSGERILLEKARELGEVLVLDFNSPSGFPYTNFDFQKQQPVRDSFASLANIGSCQLEFTRLSQATGDPKFRDVALRVYETLDRVKSGPGKYYSKTDVQKGVFTSQSLTYGAYGDSFFEYLIKLYIMLGPNDPTRDRYLRMFDESIQLMIKDLVQPCYGGRLCLGRTDDSGNYIRGMEHLNFFVPGMLLMGSDYLPDRNLRFYALELLETYSSIPELTPTGLAPEYVTFSPDQPIRVQGRYNALRPELIESLFYGYRATRDPKYQDKAWNLMMGFVNYSRSNYGFAEYNDVLQVDKLNQQRGSMPSYFMAETFKYMYLIFTSPDVLSLSTWVFNTEAHPFRISS